MVFATSSLNYRSCFTVESSEIRLEILGLRPPSRAKKFYAPGLGVYVCTENIGAQKRDQCTAVHYTGRVIEPFHWRGECYQ